MPFFRFENSMGESSEFGPKSGDLGHRILKSDFIPPDIANSDCISRPILFSDRKIKLRSSESDRIINGLTALDFATLNFATQHHHQYKGSAWVPAWCMLRIGKIPSVSIHTFSSNLHTFLFFFPSHLHTTGTFLSFFSVPFIFFALLFSLPPSRHSDLGSHSRLFSPPIHYGSCLAFFFRENLDCINTPPVVHHHLQNQIKSMPSVAEGNVK